MVHAGDPGIFPISLMGNKTGQAAPLCPATSQPNLHELALPYFPFAFADHLAVGLDELSHGTWLYFWIGILKGSFV